MEDDNIVDAEIVDDDNHPKPDSLIPADTILTPCHHGCTCGLHQQTVYGDRVPEHKPTVLDHGEMGLLVEAVGDATRLMNGFHDYLRKLRAATVRTHGHASRSLRELRVALQSDGVIAAYAERDRVEEAYADLTPDERQPAPHWLKVMTLIAVAGVVVFDSYFFQQIFLNILQVSLSDPAWKRYIGLIAAVVMAIGLLATGRILAGPVWRMKRRWRRPGSPDEPPPGRAVRAARLAAVGAVPAIIFFVLGWWASFRGDVAEEDQLNALNGTDNQVITPPIAIMLLLLSLAITVIVLEILVHNPYQAQLKRAERAIRRVRRKMAARADAAAQAVDAHESAWRDLRSARDEVISFVQAELARPWQTVILPARLRHGRAGPTAAEAKYGAKIEILTPQDDGGGVGVIEQIQITYQVFEGMAQPQPGPGPLAEVVRTVIALDPGMLRTEQGRLEQLLHAQHGAAEDVAGPAESRRET